MAADAGIATMVSRPGPLRLSIFCIADVRLRVVRLAMPAFILAITLDDVLDGFGRFFGWVSDNIGREITMFIAFGVAAVSLFLLTQFGHSPWLH